MPISFTTTEPPRDFTEDYACTYPMKHANDRVDRTCGTSPARPVHPVGEDPRCWTPLALCHDHDTSVEPRSIGWTPEGE